MDENQMYYNYPQYPQQMRQVPRQAANPYYGVPSMSAPLQNYIKGRPVVSIEEARAAQIDLDGSLYVFTDVGNKKIYTKQINSDGTASLLVYERSDEPSAAAPLYVTREEFNKVIAQINNAFNRIPEQIEQAHRSAEPASAAQKPTFQI